MSSLLNGTYKAAFSQEIGANSAEIRNKLDNDADHWGNLRVYHPCLINFTKLDDTTSDLELLVSRAKM